MRKTDTWQDNKDIIAELKQKDSHFATIFDEHTQLDQQINQLDKDMVTHASREEEIEQMKNKTMTPAQLAEILKDGLTDYKR